MRTLAIALLSLTTMTAACKRDAAGPAAGAGVSDPVAKAPEPEAKPPEPATSTPADLGSDTELEAQGCAVLENMGDLVVTDATDCDKLAADLRAFTAKNKDLLTRFSEMGKAAIDEIERKIALAAEHCRDNDAVENALQSVPH